MIMSSKVAIKRQNIFVLNRQRYVINKEHQIRQLKRSKMIWRGVSTEQIGSGVLKFFFVMYVNVRVNIWGSSDFCRYREI